VRKYDEKIWDETWNSQKKKWSKVKKYGKKVLIDTEGKKDEQKWIKYRKEKLLGQNDNSWVKKYD